MGGGLGRVTNHPDYYISDGSVSFLAGKTLFRVHRSFLERESEVFRDLFASAAEDDPPSGTDARPFTLSSDVTADDFAQLCWVWYNGEYSYAQQTKENWITILQLSKRWAFPKIRDLAVRELDALDLAPAQRISIYNEHGIEGDRLLSSYVELCRSPTLPTQADGNLLRMETLINLLQAREDAQRRAIELGHESPTSASLEDETLREIVTKVFKKGLALRPNGASTGSGAQAPNLNHERTQGTSSRETITLDKPQIPDRKTTGSSSHAPGSGGKGSQEKEQENQAQAGEGEDKKKPAEVARDKEREEKEKEIARQAKETEKKEKAEKAKEAKEAKKREEEARKKADEQKSPTNTRRHGG